MVTSRAPRQDEKHIADMLYSVRDEFESKRGELEQSLSEVLGVPWKIEVNPNQLYAYANESYAHNSIGRMIAEYGCFRFLCLVTLCQGSQPS